MDRHSVCFRWLFAVLICVAKPGAVAGDGPPLTAQDVIVAFVDSVSSIESIDAEYDYSYVYPSQVTTYRYRFVREGARWREERRGSKSADGSRRSTMNSSVMVWNGEVSLTYKMRDHKDAMGNEEVSDVYLSPDCGFNRRFSSNPESLLGEWFYDGELRPLADVLVTLKGTRVEEKDGHYLLSSEFEQETRNFGTQIGSVTATIAPEYDYLPVEYNISFPMGKDLRNIRSWKMTDFQQVVDERNGRKRWFPMQGEMFQGKPTVPEDPKLIRVQVKAVRINPDVPKETFALTVNDGALILDRTKSPAVEYVKGELRDVDDKIDAIVSEVNDALPMKRPTWLLIGLGLFVFSILGLVGYRVSRGHGN